MGAVPRCLMPDRSAAQRSAAQRGSGMSSPVSTSGLLILFGELLEGSVPAGVVGGVGGPALPDDVDPGAGQDAHGVGMVVASASGAGVKVGGPGVDVSAV